VLRVCPSIDELLADAGRRVGFKDAESLSGSRFERVEIHGTAYVVKWLDGRDDWIMRACGDDGSRQARLFSSGVLDRLPASLDHCVVAVATDQRSDGTFVTALLMHDVSGAMVDCETGSPVAWEAHRRFLAHMAAMHAAMWGFRDEVGLTPTAVHYTVLTPETAARELARGGTDPVPPAVAAGWRRLKEIEPRVATRAYEITLDPTSLLEALRSTPQTLIHADWKFGNLGEHRDGRTILLDWDRTGAGAPAMDLAWYLAVNCDLLPESKEESIEAYAQSLTELRVDLGDWWSDQLRLSLLGAFVQLGWSKAYGDPGELAWWVRHFKEAESLIA
jgi:hypothetical protein